jgi:hypothetical protein
MLTALQEPRNHAVQEPSRRQVHRLGQRCPGTGLRQRLRLNRLGGAPALPAKTGLTKTAAVEYGKYGIRVNAVSPGAMGTEMLLDLFGSEEAVDRMAAVHPIGRIGRPEEIADAVVWLFSDRSTYYTGQSLTLDGGLTAQRPSVQRPGNEHIAVLPEEPSIGQGEIPCSSLSTEAMAS